jgi:hypothetical protein
MPIPLVWGDRDGELAFEWISSTKHAIVSFEGDGLIGYAMRTGGRFRPGEIRDAPATVFPPDLRAYLAGA